jgi:hypothetical protein
MTYLVRQYSEVCQSAGIELEAGLLDDIVPRLRPTDKAEAAET